MVCIDGVNTLLYLDTMLANITKKLR